MHLPVPCKLIESTLVPDIATCYKINQCQCECMSLLKQQLYIDVRLRSGVAEICTMLSILSGFSQLCLDGWGVKNPIHI